MLIRTLQKLFGLTSSIYTHVDFEQKKKANCV